VKKAGSDESQLFACYAIAILTLTFGKVKVVGPIIAYQDYGAMSFRMQHSVVRDLWNGCGKSQ
jgi:hypothetical protein